MPFRGKRALGPNRSFPREYSPPGLPIAGVRWPPSRPSFPQKYISPSTGFSFQLGGTFFAVLRKWKLHPRPEHRYSEAPKTPPRWPPRLQSRQSKAAMRAITVLPGIAGSARLEEVPEPAQSEGAVLVRALALGVCGTDREILNGSYGFAPPGERRIVLGHESLGMVETAPDRCGLVPGDLVVGVVRRPDPEPCVACAVGEWDMCRNGRYTERGIKERHGYGAERFRIEPEFAIKIDPELGILGVLLEPASILAKAWDHIERIGHRARAWQPRVLLVTGAGPIGLLAGLMGMQRGLEVHVLDHTRGGAKEAIVRDLGGTYHS